MDTLNDLDPRTRRVLGFLIGKGLLWTNRKLDPFHGKIPIEDALWVAENAEPRVYEVLPAAMVHFPKTFIGKRAIPAELRELLRDIAKGRAPKLAEWKGIPAKNMMRWANRSLKDKRTKPIEKLKINKTFRLSQGTVEKMQDLARARGSSVAGFLEKLIESL